MDKLINGKSDYRKVVGLEINEGTTEIFQQNDDGSISSTFTDNRFWLLCNRQINSNFKRLKGDLHYKWGRQFSEVEEWKKARNIARNSKDDVYSIWNIREQHMVKDGVVFYRDLQPKEVSVLSFDIETTGLDPTARDAFVVLISMTYRSSHGSISKKLFSYDDFDSQAEMLNAFCYTVRNLNPSIIVGHNIVPFDLHYLNVIAKKNNTRLMLGRDGSEIRFNSYDSKFRVDGNRDLEFKNCYIYGREIVDTYFVAQKFDVARNFSSYGLKHLIKELGKEKEGRVFYDASQIRVNYKDPVEFAKIKAYAVDDSDDSLTIWDTMGGVFFHLAPIIPKPFQDIIFTASGSQINALMTRAYLQDGHSIPKADEAKKFEGAISFAVPGIYENCFKIDLAALYPSIMVEYEVYDEDKDPNAYLLQLVKTFREKRMYYKKLAKDTKEQIYTDMDNCYKGIVNSFYGFCGAPGLLFNSLKCAEFITLMGREILLYTIKWASGMNGAEIELMLGKNEEELEE